MICGHCGLYNYRARVHAFIHKVHGAPRDLYAVISCLLLSVQPGERGQKCGMDVHYPVPVLVDKGFPDDPHKSCQYNQPHISLRELAGDMPVV